MSTMSVKKARATGRRERATEMLYKIFIPQGKERRDKEVANSTGKPWKNQIFGQIAPTDNHLL